MPQPPVILLVAALLTGVTVARSAESPLPKATTFRRPGAQLVARPRTTSAPRANEASCRKAVQEFYDWYLPRLMREVHVTAMEQALRNRPRQFSSTLRRELLEDLAAAKRSPDEIVSLDFEPFVNSQDPTSRYVVKKAYRAGKGYWVEVHGVLDGKVNEDPDVIPELVLNRGQWTFVNFHYPAQGTEARSDLLGLLKQLRNDRRKSGGHGKRR